MFLIGNVLLSNLATNHGEGVSARSTSLTLPKTTSNGKGLFNHESCPGSDKSCISKNQIPCAQSSRAGSSLSGTQKRNRKAYFTERTVTGSEVNRQIGSSRSSRSTTPKTSGTCSLSHQRSIVDQKASNKTKSQNIQKETCDCRASCTQIFCQKCDPLLSNSQVSSVLSNLGLKQSTTGRNKIFVNRQPTPPIKETKLVKSSISREKEIQDNSFKRGQSSANSTQSDVSCHNRTPLNAVVDTLSATSTTAT